MDDKLIERIKAGNKWGGICTDASYVQEMEARILADAAIIKAAEELADGVDEWQISRSVGCLELEQSKAENVARLRTAYRAAVEARG